MLILCTGIVFFACSDDKDEIPEPADLQVSPSKLEFLGNGGRDSVTILTRLETWSAVSSETWCKVSPDGSLLRVNVEAITTPTDRNAVITVISGEERKEISVFQRGASSLAADVEKVELDANGTAVDVKITASSADWEIAENLPEWCRANKNGEYLVVSAVPNESTDPLVGEIVLTLYEKELRLTVEQAGKKASEDKVGGVYTNESGDVVGIVIAITETDKYVVSLKEENDYPLTLFAEPIDTREWEKDGKTACDKIRQEYDWESNYTCIMVCKELESTTGVTGWYIPGCSEDVVWDALADNIEELNKALAENGGDALKNGGSNDRYCTSTMYYDGIWESFVYRILLTDVKDKYESSSTNYFNIRPVLRIAK